jgi:hypothetical protein
VATAMRPTNAHRIVRVKKVELYSKVYDVEGSPPEDRCFDILGDFQFVLCLEGNGFENRGVWVVLCLRIFPVVIESAWSATLRRYTLTIMFIDSIGDLSQRRPEEFLDNSQDHAPDDAEVLWTSYWEKVIRKRIPL